METSTSVEKHVIQWTSQNQLKDFDFVDDLFHLSHIHEQMQMKTNNVTPPSVYIIKPLFCFPPRFQIRTYLMMPKL
ncbi:unnamed protein product [Schistosoma margrebowiei]|uniref:Uncharacterized protein n=1 Tax=Schistosoma margrebowiei TaxID=48269 RepID=A0A183LTB3_9TREM|nr:unnamed protein product [Schistosoma margrebowiei]